MIVGTVVIGRNVSLTLEKALLSSSEPCIYVDSGSTDHSIKIAQNLKVRTLALDPKIPFTAARARNEGYIQLLKSYPEIEAIQFLDGDCVMEEGWIDIAKQTLLSDSQLAAVFGTLKEVSPESSVYNLLCQMEWETPSGIVTHFPGIVMVRCFILKKLEGYNSKVIAGEDSEFSVRIGLAGWQICKLDAIMGYHDANLKSFRQWLIRTVRSGHAIAERRALHKEDCGHQLQSTLIWGFVFPIGILLGSFFSPFLSGVLALAYFVLFFKIFHERKKRYRSLAKEAFLYAFFNVAGKIPQFMGITIYYLRKLFSQEPKIIECR